jgi:hypothetical protein
MHMIGFVSIIHQSMTICSCTVLSADYTFMHVLDKSTCVLLQAVQRSLILFSVVKHIIYQEK